MNKLKTAQFSILVVLIILLAIFRHSGRLFSLSTYTETFVVLLGGFLLIGLLLLLYKYLSTKE